MTDKELYQQMLHFIECSGYRAEAIKKELKARLAQPDCVCGEPDSEGVHRKDKPCYMPPKKEWVGLTDEEISEIYDACDDWEHYEYERLIEAKLKEKNT